MIRLFLVKVGVCFRLACLFSPLGKLADRAIYVCLRQFISFSNWSPIISVSTRPICAIFSPYESVLGEIYRSGPRFSITQGTLPWQPILGKIGKITFIWQAGVAE